VTEDDERRKLALVVEAARQFWPWAKNRHFSGFRSSPI